MRKLSEFAKPQDVPFNEDIEIDTRISYHEKNSLLRQFDEIAVPLGGITV